VAGFQVIQRDDLDAAALEDRLYEFNAAATGRADGRDLGFVVEEPREMVAGAFGYTWAGIAELRYVWVREDRRGQGVGAALMRAAMDEARARGCRFMFLTTHSFQAPGFYVKLGFETVAVIADKPLGHAEHVLRLTL
jgi:GNAT superfamily N-acetyltransferase